MNPCHRAMVAASRLHDLYNKRVCTIMACIMTDALETQGIHMPAKVYIRHIYVYILFRDTNIGFLQTGFQLLKTGLNPVFGFTGLQRNLNINLS